MKVRFKYTVEPFIDEFTRTIEADSEEHALTLWRRSILSYHATLKNVEIVEEE